MLPLSQLVYWTRRGRDVVARQGWIYKTREQWFEETGLSREEQENARRRLRRLNLAQEWRGGRPARLYFRIHTGTLSAALSHIHQLAQPVHLLTRLHARQRTRNGSVVWSKCRV